jgi:hypothetical protein
MPIIVKGIGFDSAMKFAEQQSGERAVREALERLGFTHGISYAQGRGSHETIELRYAADAWETVFQLAGGETKEPERSYFQRMGRFIATTNLSSIYRGVLQLIGSPSMMAKRVPMLWKTYFPGVRVESDTSAIKEGRYEDRVYGFEGTKHIGPMAEGWLHYAFNLVGAKDLSVNEAATVRGEYAAPGPLAYTIKWRP